MVNVPEFMPVLSEGSHKHPSEGACIMEYVSYLAGETFSDTPKCVHPDLAGLARGANDWADHDERQELLALIPRLMGTADAPKDFNPPWVSPMEGERLADSFKRHLVGALDEYDRLTGRTQPEPLTTEQLKSLVELTQ